jgi:tetratricopeptide (TPR) repeat protein
MRLAPFVVLGVAAGTIAAAVMLLPGERERYAMALHDNRMDDALEILQAQPVGEMSAFDLLEWHRLAELLGRSEDSARALRAYHRLEPSDVDALDQLAGVYRSTQQPGPYRETLRALFEADPDEQRFHDLVGLYRLAGDTEAELEVAGAALGGGWLDNDDVARTGLLYAAAGRLDEAADALARLPTDQFEPYRQAHLTRIAVLLKLYRIDEAVTDAVELATLSPAAVEPLDLVLRQRNAEAAAVFETEIKARR